jgi:26S proteasome regulatory subunit T2
MNGQISRAVLTCDNCVCAGEPGTGKTLLAKAVANQTSATFLRVVGSELIQKYLGEGPKLVRELFRVADDNSPAIVFIDEIDAVGSKR